ncbi:hypothetical protein [Actinoalloteichus caeruleus]|uniref:hypothetical protein n=1 Tax=Actinoalloteichus cyanogriseus TaxID=2893586 RepID=UPI0012DDD126|nr:hypothetical protein [Actinoalloteichus caeruleus]
MSLSPVGHARHRCPRPAAGGPHCPLSFRGAAVSPSKTTGRRLVPGSASAAWSITVTNH